MQGMQQIQQLSTERSVNTTLISYYLKEGSNTSNALLTKELNACDNIKSKATRKAVATALKAIQLRLKELNSIPENGLAVFSGNGQYV